MVATVCSFVLIWSNLLCIVGGLAVGIVSLCLNSQWSALFENADPEQTLSILQTFFLLAFILILVGSLGLYGTIKAMSRRTFAIKVFLLITLCAWVCQIFTTLLLRNISTALDGVESREFISQDFTLYESGLVDYIERHTDQVWSDGGCQMIGGSTASISCPDARWFENFAQAKCESHEVVLENSVSSENLVCASSEINCMCRDAITSELSGYAVAMYACVATFTGLVAVVLLCTCYVACCSKKAERQASLPYKAPRASNGGHQHQRAYVSARP